MKRNELRDKAEKSEGFVVVDLAGSYIIRWHKKGGPAVQFYEDGSILRCDVRNDLAMRMTVKEAAKILGL